MHSIPFSEIRDTFTDVAHKVQYLKEPYVLTKNNKPAAGLVPIEYLMLIAEIFKKSKKSKELAEITQKYVLLLNNDEMANIKQMLDNPPKANKRLKAMIKAAKDKFED